jgi:hypothetical protein
VRTCGRRKCRHLGQNERPWWLADVIAGRLSPRGFPFKTPLGDTYHGEQFRCTARRAPWSADGLPSWIPLTFEHLSGFDCGEFEFSWTGQAQYERADREGALEVPDCSRGNFSIRIPYAVHSVESVPCGRTLEGDFVCAANGRRSMLKNLPAGAELSLCCAYGASQSRPRYLFLHELLILADLSKK